MIEVPIALLMPALFSLIIYFGIGLTIDAEKFFYFYFTLVILQFTASSYGYFLASVFTRIETAI
jgi:ABC-type multidrug transport system permease subunit